MMSGLPVESKSAGEWLTTRLGRRSLEALGVALCAGIVAMAAGTIVQTRTETLAAAEANLRRIDFVLTDGVGRLVSSIDAELAEIAAETMQAGGPAAFGGTALHARLRQGLANLPGALRASVFDAGGRLVATSVQDPPPLETVTDRTYFAEVRKQLGAGLVVGTPMQSRLDGRWTFVLARRLQAGDGSFLGLAGMSVDLEYLRRLFAATVPEAGARVVLLRDDMVMLVRQPYVPDLYGRSMAWTASNSAIFADGRLEGSGRYTGGVDSQPKVVAGRRVAGYPLAVSIAVPEDTLLAPWRRLAWGIGVLAGSAVLALGGVLAMLSRQITRREASEQALASAHGALAQERGRLTQVLDTTSDGFWEWHLGSGLVDWSGRCCALLGLPAAGGVFHIEQVMTMIHPEDRERFRAAVRQHIEAGHPLDIEARWQIPGSDMRWLASRARVVRDSAGRPLTVVGANTDITLLKALEEHSA